MPAHDRSRYRLRDVWRYRVVRRYNRCRRPKGVGRRHGGGGTMTVIGYARVSTDGQHLSAQRAALKAAGAAKVFEEKESGVISGSKQLAKAVRVDAGDVLVVTRLDRLARSTRD